MPAKDVVIRGAGVLTVAGVLIGGGAYIVNEGGGDPGVTCDQTVTTRAALVTSLGDLSGTNGDTVCVTTSLTGSRITLTTDFTNQVRVIAQPADQTIDMVSISFSTSDKITIEGFDLTNETDLDMGNSDDIHIIRNYCHDQEVTCISGQGATDIDGTWIMGNRFERIFFNGDSESGYGVFGRNFDNLRIEYNHCDQGSDGTINYGRDCYEIDNAEDFTFIGNENINVGCSDCGASHPDNFMFWNGSDRGTIKDNVNVVGLEVLISPDGSDTLIQNNLVAHLKTNCFDAHPNDSSGDIAPLNFTFDHNTAAECNLAFPQPGDLNGGGLLMNGAVGSRGGNVWTDNLMPNGGCPSTATFASAPTGNVFYEGTNPCGLSSGTNYMTLLTPDWGGTDYATMGVDATYQLANPPTGYEDAGYQPAPHGPDECDC